MVFSSSQGIPLGGSVTPGVRRIIIATGAVYLAQLLFGEGFSGFFGLHPPSVLRLQVWRLFTYMFLHGGMFHILFNMLVLYMFGIHLERMWGTRRFTRYYLLCGVGAGLVTMTPLPVFFNAIHIGASGAVYGLLLAFGMLFPRARVYVFFVLPMEARYLVVLLGFVSLAGSLSAPDGTSHIGHLGGLLAGYVLLRWDRLAPSGSSGFFERFGRRRRRARFDRYAEEEETWH